MAPSVNSDLVAGSHDRVQRLWVHLRIQPLDEERRLHFPSREQVEQPRKDVYDGEVLPFGHLCWPHAKLELSSLAEVVERHRHD